MGHFFLRYPVYFECLVGVIHTYMLSQTDTDIHCVQKKSEPLKDFATCVNLHQIKYIFTHTATCISNDVLKCLGKKQLLRLINQIVNKITQKLDYTAQLLSTQKVITVPTFKDGVESVLISHGHTFTVTYVCH